MKKLGLTLGLCLLASVSFGQKKAVSEALKLAKDSKPNFAEARTKIKEALEHEETKNDAKTWYTAGQIEDLQFTAENTKQMLGQQPNEAVMYESLLNVYPYFKKANELDLLPDVKGKVKPKFTKDIKATLKANMAYYLNGGVYFFEQKDYKKSFDFFDQYVEIADSELIKEGVKSGEVPVDSTYIFANYYAAITACQLESDDHTLAINALKRAGKIDYKRNDMLQLLAEEYKNAKDSLSYLKTLEEGMSIFPKEPYYILNLVGAYINAEQNEKAIEYLNTAIINDPTNVQLYNVAGILYESKDYTKAEEFFLKAIELDSENAEIQSNLGRVYFNQGVTQWNEASDIADVKKFHEEREKAKELFRKALPYYEKAYQLSPDASDKTIIALHYIYYNLDMGDKYEGMAKIMKERNLITD
jgi:tetratricopeptide (TPR) repeat protein